MGSTHALYNRRGRVITDQDAKDITRVEELAYDLRIKEVMSIELKTVMPDETMATVLEKLRVDQISGLPVIEGSSLVGIISLEDVIRAMVASDMDAPIRKYMTTNVITANSYDPVVEALEMFTKMNVGRFPVVDENKNLVGMLTKGDITRGIMLALQRDYQEEEIRRYRASHLFEDINSDRTSLILRYRIKVRDFTHGGAASSDIKRALIRLGASPQIARRCGIAIYEAEMNLIIHTTDGGMIRVEIEPHRILMQAVDDGPGIPDIEKALQAGWSTASDKVRELGFGAGMGLVNIGRCVDKMDLTSAAGKGTRLEMKIYLQPDESFREKGYFTGDQPQ